MAKIEVYVPWMFADKWTAQTLEFVEAKEGKHGTELHLAGKDGDVRTFPGKIKNLKALLKKYGDETNQWPEGLLFNVTAKDAGFVFEPVPLVK